jgi:hypothetical protein
MGNKDMIKYYTKLLRTIQICVEQLSNKQNAKNIKDPTVKTHNPFVNAQGLCWTMALGYMFADKSQNNDI